MQTITSRAELHRALSQNNTQPIGFVPTMGALHEGHAALVRRARAENSLVVVSIFVNPTQFNDKNDLGAYPRTPEADAALLKTAGCDIIFFPAVEEMYPAGTSEKSPGIELHGLDTVMEGKFRPGHFAGVIQIVKKLFEAVGPCNAYFGEKDFQQLAIIRRMVEVFQMPVKIIPCPIVRETDGLAMSSRNMRLTKEERAVAPLISQTIFKAKEMWPANPAEALKEFVTNEIAKQPLMKLDYVEIADVKTLQPVAPDQKTNAVLCIAVFLGKVRLIDNVVLM